MEPALYHCDLARGPEAAAFWLTAEDGVRLRVGAFCTEAAKGTVLLFPGRTEYIEKYAHAAEAFGAAGLATLAIDWRGQGLADRLLNDPMTGHVHHFEDYQHDVRAMMDAAEALGLPRPYHLLAHSMGGAIGLRALMEAIPVASASFSGPMWGIQMNVFRRALGWSLSGFGKKAGFDHVYAPTTTGARSYVLIEDFGNNKLTRDRDMYQYMIDQIADTPELRLGGPSLRWLNEALQETRDLARRPAPPVPCMTITGTEERIVDLDRIRHRMDHWPDAEMHWVEGGRHELLMDTPQTRAEMFDALIAFYARHSEPEQAVSRPA